MSDPNVLKRFVSTGDRLVHFRVAGHGPPVILLHDSVKSSAALLPLIRKLSARFCVYALDTPGYGNSDPLPGAPTISDLAQCVVDAMDAIGLDKVSLYGRHTSSKIVLELLVERPDRFCCGIMDGFSLAGTQSDPGSVDRYLPPFEPDESGAFLAKFWAQISDTVRWFPWFERKAGARMAIPLREAEDAHKFALDFLMAGRAYASGYLAALNYEGWSRLSLLDASTPAVFMTAEDDVNFHFLARLPDTVEVMEVPPGRDSIAEKVEHVLIGATAGQRGQAGLIPEAARRSYVDLPHGQVHVRRGGCGTSIPALVLHDLPGAASGSATFLETLQRSMPVIAPDLPGCGESAPLTTSDAASIADLLSDLLQSMSCDRVNVVASGVSTSLAIAFAARYPGIVSNVVLDGYFDPDSELPGKYCPSISYDPSGAHLHQIWHMLRNSYVQWPWYEKSVDSIRWRDADFEPDVLFARLVDILKQPGHYGEAAKAALGYDAAAGLKQVKCPVHFLHARNDPAYGVPPELAGASVTHIHTHEADTRAALIARLLSGRSRAHGRSVNS